MTRQQLPQSTRPPVEAGEWGSAPGNRQDDDERRRNCDASGSAAPRHARTHANGAPRLLARGAAPGGIAWRVPPGTYEEPIYYNPTTAPTNGAGDDTGDYQGLHRGCLGGCLCKGLFAGLFCRPRGGTWVCVGSGCGFSKLMLTVHRRTPSKARSFIQQGKMQKWLPRASGYPEGITSRPARRPLGSHII